MRIFLAIFVLSCTACAGHPQKSAPQQLAQAPKTDAAATPPAGYRQCLRETGSHIRRNDGSCITMGGYSFTRDELWSTGAIDLSEGLKKLLP